MSARRTPTIAVVLAVCLLGALACTSPGTGPGGGAAGARDAADGPRDDDLAVADAGPRWRACPEVVRRRYGSAPETMRYDCATIDVPLDWAAATGPEVPTLPLALLRVRAVGQRERVGTLVVNPGGPGVSGVDAAAAMSLGRLSDEILNRFDVVGFDPRGVGRSAGISCVSDADWDAVFGADQDPRDPAEFAALVELGRRVGAGCGRRYGDRLGAYSTYQSARDLDAVRVAVGDDQLTYLGYSYGTLLGATYAHLHPDRVRAMVLDGAIDPAQGLVSGSRQQAAGFERAFEAFARWCAAATARCPPGADAPGLLDEMLAQARRQPVAGADGRAATAGWIFYAVVAAMYDDGDWPRLGQALAALHDGDPGEVFALADRYTGRGDDGSYSDLFDANLVINCADRDVELDPVGIRELQRRWRAEHPVFGGALAVGLLTCAAWPGPADPYPSGPAIGAPPIVVIGTTGDPATPYEQAPRLAGALGVGVLVTWEADRHTAYPRSACVAAAVDAYLLDLVVPADGLRCRDDAG
ncbi:alpha/beta hydrolase [Solwaraspora sp. WMMB335]|uniref:alpha/beta hydrolase n=1 Tax=Solwaraspora sp. WMMB335 TaxID=3404118 RepID=UPI003B955729